MKQEALEASIAASASKATYGGATTIGIGWLMSNEFAVLVGMVIGLAGFLVNLYYRWKQDRREEAEHKARMAHVHAQSEK